MNKHEKTDHNQLPLFQMEPAPSTARASVAAGQPVISAGSSLLQAIDTFEHYMIGRGFTDNTRQAFRLDMAILSDYLGPDCVVGEISTVTLKAFVAWLQDDRGVPCSPKTLERRITTLKVFFGWLAEEGYIPRDVAAPLIHNDPGTPLPDILQAEQIEALLKVTEARRSGTSGRRPDARPHLVLTLVLHTGIKKAECVNIHLNHLDLRNQQQPALWIRYKQKSRRHKERRIIVPTWWPDILNEYLSQYTVEQKLFPWSARNLEYVLTSVAEEAGVPRLTFEMLRWTSALNDTLGGMPPEDLRQKMGLSEITWYEVENTLDLLVRRSGQQKQ